MSQAAVCIYGRDTSDAQGAEQLAGVRANLKQCSMLDILICLKSESPLLMVAYVSASCLIRGQPCLCGLWQLSADVSAAQTCMYATVVQAGTRQTCPYSHKTVLFAGISCA
jgi:hypothetical protein